MKNLLTILALLIGAAVAHAGDYQTVNAGYLRAMMIELREWNYWQGSCDQILGQIQFENDADAVQINTAFYVPAQKALAEWRIETAKPAAQRKAEANREFVRELWRQNWSYAYVTETNNGDGTVTYMAVYPVQEFFDRATRWIAGKTE